MKLQLKKKPKQAAEQSKKAKKLHFFSRKILVSIALFFTLAIIIAAFLFTLFYTRLFPAIYIANTHVGALTLPQAKNKLTQTLQERLNKPLTFIYQNQQFQIDLSTVQPDLNLDQSLNQAFEYGHSRFYYQPVYLSLNPDFNSRLKTTFAQIEKSLNQAPIEAQLKIEQNEITVTPSQDGLALDEDELTKRLTDYLNTGQTPSLILPTKKSYPKLSYSNGLTIKHLLDQVKLNPIKLTFQNSSWTLDLDTLIPLLDLTNSQSSLAKITLFNTPLDLQSATIGPDNLNDQHLSLNQNHLSDYLTKIATDIDQDVKEPLFQFDGKRVTEFQPPQIGQHLNFNQTKTNLIQALTTENFKSIPLAVDITQPKNKLSNELGIKELIGEGISNFAHSIPNRIYNIGLAASRINGVLVPPGETFSFVNTVGDISGASGYKQAYVIKSGRTVLDDGGGVCQVSTTLFRAALNAGVPIPERTAHAYRVEYYEQGFPPGLDATIFVPGVDLKFKNDTPAYILIQARTEGLTLYVDFYGTSDGRISTLTKPIITEQTPPLPEIRQDDPTLPKGTVKQVDFPAWGAKVFFSRTVSRDGQTLINETFKSNFRPWQAIFLVGTKEG